ncbi:sensor histidine kinase [Frankia sp. CNm7]|uniref:histidine kinase n=1 Tax=Frankia nepalensis TaxID=1836974 RepID=A0A937RSQ2_9ACTN|nr:histidine kinase [Frankia nepalensis]MBL7499044.1 sensor histidine kinase [Frankia nepalensis]MBL7515641.1 sensor histidine kinase [Frankia nepalensis]MBL7520528.1 sensor histidine kinase [Frankia nepalensis]MBL7632048.1 two-component sensor histidine kinase [Frankia nepalensis]
MVGRLLSAHPTALDTGLALLLIAFSLPGLVTRAAGLGATAMTVVMFAPLALRRRSPAGVFAVIAVLALAQWLLDLPCEGALALLVAFYTVAARCSRRTILAAAGVLAVGVVLATLRWATDPQTSTLGAATLMITLVTLAGVLGLNVGTRRAYVAALLDRAARLERERDQQAQLATAAERARIAREMHDVIAHNLAVMVALADGATFAVDHSPSEASEAIGAVSAAGREALAEMRRLLGVLRDDRSTGATAPQPGITQIDGLIAQVRRTGLPVSFQIEGALRAFAPGVQLTVFRLVQEALTNTLKHGGPAATAAVRLAFDDTGVDVVVDDTGRGAAIPATGPRGGGQGLVGMRERAAVHGGTVTAGPCQGGGWRVTARVNGQLAQQPVEEREAS